MIKDKGKNRLTIAEAAERLECSKTTVRNGIRKGLLEGVRGGICGRVFWVSERSVEKLRNAYGRATR